MQSEPIPDEVIREAEGVLAPFIGPIGIMPDEEDDFVASIARALRARDKRAAEIVRNLGPSSQDMTSTMICAALDAAAAAILAKEADQP